MLVKNKTSLAAESIKNLQVVMALIFAHLIAALPVRQLFDCKVES